MTALASVFGPRAESSRNVLASMMAAMPGRASEPATVITAPGAAMSAARHEWEETVSGWSGPLMIDAGDWVIAADATLYYIRDLQRKLGLPGREMSSVELLLAALRRWGHRFADYVEGDYAVVALERASNHVLLARDFGGRRNLACTIGPERTLYVASSPLGVVAAPGVSGDLDPVFIATSAAGVGAHGYRTAFRVVSVVPGGATLSFDGAALREVRRWEPPAFGSGWEPTQSPHAAAELAEAIGRATAERVESSKPTTVWMSGGWDSTAVFGSACGQLGGYRRGSREVLPISMTYPPGDTGNEDSFIRATADRWNAPVRWVDTEQIELMVDDHRRLARRDDPMAQPFESTVRHLSAVTRMLGSRVALDGFGGDHLFHVSSGAIIADHFFHGRWPELWRSWREWPGGIREFARISVLPHLSPGLRRWVAELRRRPIAGYWDRTLPAWILASAAVKEHLSPESEFAREPGEGASAYESRKGLLTSFIPRAISWNHAIGLDEGVQIRSPLFDRRVITLSTPRPLSDRGSGGDSKRLLRLAMKGLIPDSVLAARPHKTGTPVGYFKRQLQRSLPQHVDRYFNAGGSALATLGILDTVAFKSAAEHYLRTGDHTLGALLHLTVETERWLAEGPGAPYVVGPVRRSA